MSITIALADAEHAVREGFRCLFEREKDFKVVGEFSDGLETVTRVALLRPRVLLVETALPGLNGLDVARRVRRASPATAILMMSRHANPDLVAAALTHGAAGFVAKHATVAALCGAIRSVSVGERYLGAPIARPQADARRRLTIDAYQTLTAREREVIQLIVLPDLRNRGNLDRRPTGQ